MQQESVLQYIDIDDELFTLLWKYSICYSILPYLLQKWSHVNSCGYVYMCIHAVIGFVQLQYTGK